MMFVTLLVFAAPARRERLALDKLLVRRLHWWRFVAEPHAVDRVHGAPRIEPVVVGTMLHRDDEAADLTEPVVTTFAGAGDAGDRPRE